MIIQTSVKELLSSTTFLADFCQSSSLQPTLDYILIQANQYGAFAIANSVDRFCIRTLGGRVIEEGTVCLNKDALLEGLRISPEDDSVKLGNIKQGFVACKGPKFTHVYIDKGPGFFNFPIQFRGLDDFSYGMKARVEELMGKSRIGSVNAVDLASAAEFTFNSFSDTNAASSIRGCSVEGDSRGIALTSTDGSVVSRGHVAGNLSDFSIVLSDKSIKVLANSVKGVVGLVDLYLKEGVFYVVGDGFLFGIKVMETKFPDFTSFFGTSLDNMVRLASTGMENLSKAARYTAKLVISEDNLLIECDEGDVLYEKDIPANFGYEAYIDIHTFVKVSESLRVFDLFVDDNVDFIRFQSKVGDLSRECLMMTLE